MMMLDPDTVRAAGVGAVVGAVLGLLAAGRGHVGAGLGFGAAAGVLAGLAFEKQINTVIDANTFLQSATGGSLVGAATAAINDLDVEL